MSRSLGEKRLRLARDLARRHRLREAHEAGWLGFEKAQLVARLLRDPACAEAEGSWVRDAIGVTVKRLRDYLPIRSCLRTAPGDEGDPRSSRSCLPTSPGEEHDSRSSRSCLPSCPGGGSGPLPPDDATWHRSLRRAPGRTRARVRALGERTLEQPQADLQLRLRLTDEQARRFLAAVRARREDLAAWALVRPLPDAPPSLRLAQSFAHRRLPVPDWVALLAMLEDYAGTWDDPDGMPRRAADAIYIRDGWRCMAPGCTSRRNLEKHHVV